MFGLLELLNVVRYRRFLIMWSVLMTALFAGLAGFILPAKYESIARVQVDSIQRNDLTGLYAPRLRVAEFLGQQAAIAGSRTVALQVIDDLSVDGVLSIFDYTDQWRRETGGETVAGNDLKLWVADELLSDVSIDADAIESTLEIAYRAKNSAQAARVANSFANSYMAIIAEQKQRRFARTAQSFSDETTALADDVLEARQELANFRNESGILPIGRDRIEAAELEYGEISTRLAAAIADLSEANSLVRQAEATPRDELISFPIPNDAIAARQAQLRLGGVIAQLSRLSDRYGEAYPDYIEADRERQSLETTILRSIRERADYARRRVAALQAQSESLKVQVSEIHTTRDAYQLLENRLATRQETFNLVTSRSLQEAAQSRVDGLQVILLARAVPSPNTATPSLPIIVAIGIIIGAGIGCSAAVCLELYEGRVRTEGATMHLLRAASYGMIELPREYRRALPPPAKRLPA